MKKLTLDKVTIGYENPLIREVSLDISKGKLIALLGSNGSGKSTFIKTLLKIIKPIEGEIRYGDKLIQDYSAQEWSNIFAAVFSGIPYTPMIKVKELITIGANNPKSTVISQTINNLAIASLLDNFANEISDGQLQKVMIARALIQDTPFVIFDEPTAHLDFRHKKEVFTLLKELVQTTQKTFIIITHEILQALAISDEIWYIEQNKLHRGSAEEIEQRFGLKEEVLKLNEYVRN